MKNDIFASVRWLPLAWIPNQDGFKLEVLTKDQKVIRTHVIKSESGHHSLDNVTFSELTGWRKAQV